MITFKINLYRFCLSKFTFLENSHDLKIFVIIFSINSLKVGKFSIIESNLIKFIVFIKYIDFFTFEKCSNFKNFKIIYDGDRKTKANIISNFRHFKRLPDGWNLLKTIRDF